MTWDPNKFVKLVLSWPDGTQGKFLYVLKTTAAFYGWDQEFEPWSPKPHSSDGKYEYFQRPLPHSHLANKGGRRHFICRSESRQGHPAGMTNAFRLSRNCGLADLAELAHFTTGTWCWITCPWGGRRSRDEWEQIYQAGTYVNRRMFPPAPSAFPAPAR